MIPKDRQNPTYNLILHVRTVERTFEQDAGARTRAAGCTPKSPIPASCRRRLRSQIGLPALLVFFQRASTSGAVLIGASYRGVTTGPTRFRLISELLLLQLLLEAGCTVCACTILFQPRTPSNLRPPIFDKARIGWSRWWLPHE